MAVVTLPPISYATFEETFAALSAVLRETEQRRLVSLRQLAERVRRDNNPTPAAPADEGAPDDPEPQGAAVRGQVHQAPERFAAIQLPRRTTHGGDFGPAVRAKLIAEALGRRGW